ncbi:hypothetical protein [uncultured Tenacibaculum sp.]|uniref:hypothetical protein n=1 Tax=uncultured Tenacibaculum sp. TaxID=174713 RepID=UPI00260C86A9|nr:hypothetical protein [uncultured Tenacibaculum sp.]
MECLLFANEKEVKNTKLDKVIKELKLNKGLTIADYSITKSFLRCEVEVIIEDSSGNEIGSINVNLDDVESEEACDEFADAIAELVDTLVNG